MRTAVNTVGKGGIVLQVLLGYYSSGAVSIMGDQSNILCRVRSPYVPKRHDWDAQVKLCSLRFIFRSGGSSHLDGTGDFAPVSPKSVGAAH